MSWLIPWFALAHGVQPGAYALEVEIVTSTKLPVIGTKHVRTVSESLVNVSPEGAGWVQEQRTCAVRVEGGGPAQTTMPPAFLKALPVQRIPLADEGDTYRIDGGPITLGADPDAPLPMEADDAAVIDADHDGHPGMTVWVDVPVFGRVDMYIVQRAHSVLEGQWRGDGADGQVVVKQMAQRTLSASHKALAANPPIEPVEGASRFRLVPVGQATCEAVADRLRQD